MQESKNHNQKSRARRLFDGSLASVLCVFAIFFSSGSLEATHTLAHLVLGEPCAQISLANEIESNDKTAISNHVQKCLVKEALSQLVTNPLSLSSGNSVEVTRLAETNQLFPSDRIGFAQDSKIFWQSPRGPPFNI